MSIKNEAIVKTALGTLAILLASPALAQQAPAPSVAPPLMKRLTPALADYTDGVLFGDVWRRTELAPRDRSLVTVAVLIATGKTAQLPGHLERALDNGVRPGEIAGLVTHLAFYSGWPNAVSSLEVVDTVYRARGIDPAAVRTPDTRLPLPASDAARRRTVETGTAPTAPKLASLTNDVLFADLWRRPDLSPRDRSLVTIAALAAGSDADQLAFHVRRGIENGLTQGQIVEAITHLAFYAGWPKSMAAVAVVAKSAAPDQAAERERLKVIPAASGRRAGSSANFTGSVTVSSSFTGADGSRLGGATVSFARGARTNWHSHPMGQLLVVTDGIGLVQDEGGAPRVIRKGDTVWTAPDVKHWHGASSSQAMSHLAVTESVDGKNVTWLEPVSDAVYRQQPDDQRARGSRKVIFPAIR